MPQRQTYGPFFQTRTLFVVRAGSTGIKCTDEIPCTEIALSRQTAHPSPCSTSSTALERILYVANTWTFVFCRPNQFKISFFAFSRLGRINGYLQTDEQNHILQVPPAPSEVQHPTNLCPGVLLYHQNTLS